MLAVHDELVLDELLEEAAGQNLGAARSFTDLWAMTTGLGECRRGACMHRHQEHCSIRNIVGRCDMPGNIAGPQQDTGQLYVCHTRGA
jgi:hypothetical protein